MRAFLSNSYWCHRGAFVNIPMACIHKMTCDNKMNMKLDNVRIIRVILDLHGVIVDPLSGFMFILLSPFIIISIFVYLL